MSSLTGTLYLLAYLFKFIEPVLVYRNVFVRVHCVYMCMLVYANKTLNMKQWTS